MPSSFFLLDKEGNAQPTKTLIRNKRKLSFFIDDLILSYRKHFSKAELAIIFCDDDYLLQLNRKFLKHETLTDIITFDLSEPNEEVLIGEIYISIDRIKENAEAFNVAFADELLRVILHGSLHLCGFKDKGKEAKEKMTEMENKYIAIYKSTLE